MQVIALTGLPRSGKDTAAKYLAKKYGFTHFDFYRHVLVPELKTLGLKVSKENATRLELRSPDPACNPYLAFSVMLAAGLEGIEKGYEAPAPVEENVYVMGEEERKRRGIGTLPASLYEAILLAENSEVVRKALGDHVFNNFIANKKLEWDEYRTHISQFELDRYLPKL